MRILWVTPFLPNARAGHAGGQAVHRWLTAFAQGHEVTVLARLEPSELPDAERLRPLVHALHLRPFARPEGRLAALRIVGSYLRLGAAARRMARAGGFDAVHVEWLETGLGFGDPGVPVVAVAHDELGKPARRRLSLAEGVPAKALAWLGLQAVLVVQRLACRSFDVVLALSEQDRDELRRRLPGTTVDVLPFSASIEAAADAEREADHLLFVGAMNRDTNVDAMTWFCREVLPRVRRERPAVRLTIAGASPAQEVLRLAEQPGVEVTGFVEDLAPLYARASAFVSPLRVGGGIIAKNIDAMAAGCPVVTTRVGNEGIGAQDGRDVLVADTPEAFAAAVLQVLGHPELAAALSENAPRFVASRFGVPQAVEAFERADALAQAARVTT